MVWVLSNNGTTVDQQIIAPRAIALGGVEYPPELFTTWSQTDQIAVGIYVVQQATRPDERFYTTTGQTYTRNGNVFDEAYTLTERPLAAIKVETKARSQLHRDALLSLHAAQALLAVEAGKKLNTSLATFRDAARVAHTNTVNEISTLADHAAVVAYHIDPGAGAPLYTNYPTEPVADLDSYKEEAIFEFEKAITDYLGPYGFYDSYYEAAFALAQRIVDHGEGVDLSDDAALDVHRVAAGSALTLSAYAEDLVRERRVVNTIQANTEEDFAVAATAIDAAIDEDEVDDAFFAAIVNLPFEFDDAQMTTAKAFVTIKPLASAKTHYSIAYDVQNLTGQPAPGNIANTFLLEAALAPASALSVTFTPDPDIAKLAGGSTFADGKFIVGAEDAGLFWLIFSASITQNDNRDLFIEVLKNNVPLITCGASATGTMQNSESIMQLVSLAAGDEITYKIAHDNTQNRDHAGTLQVVKLY